MSTEKIDVKITDSPIQAADYAKRNIPYIVVLNEENRTAQFPSGAYCVEGMDAVDDTYKERVYRRFHGIPWDITETVRLKIREITVDDVPRLYELYSGEGITKYMEPLFPEMQKEIVALRKEIDRISNTANFNGTSLFNNGTQGIAIHAGETSKTANQITITLKAMSASSMADSNNNTVNLNSEVDISTATQAQASIDVVNKAIDIISSMRSDFGALQNRLEHTINNLGVQTENLSAAESRIRDVDMAKEMMTYTKNNILVQASQAMLAQANQVPQGVLQLLQ